MISRRDLLAGFSATGRAAASAYAAVGLLDNLGSEARADQATPDGLAIVSTVADLRATAMTAGKPILLLGYYKPGDFGGGIFVPTEPSPQSGDGARDDGGLVLADGGDGRWKRQIGHTVTPQMFGARADGKSHPISNWFQTLEDARTIYPNAVSLNDEVDGLALQAALDCRQGAQTVRVFCPAGSYRTSLPIEMYSLSSLEGESFNNTRIQYAGGATKRYANARDGQKYSAIVWMHLERPGDAQGLGSQSLRNIQIECLPGNAVDSYVFVDSVTVRVSKVFFRGTVKAEHSFLRTSPAKTFDVTVEQCLFRSMVSKGGNYQRGEFSNLSNETPIGIDIGSTQTLRIIDNFIQNCGTNIRHSLGKNANTAATVLITGNRIESGYNSNNSDYCGIHLDSSSRHGGSYFLVNNNFFELGPSQFIGRGNPAPHRAVRVMSCRMAHFFDNWFSCASTATYGSDNAPYYFDIIEEKSGNIKDLHIRNNFFRTRNFPIKVTGEPVAIIRDNYSTQPNGAGVEYAHSPNVIGRLEPNAPSPYVGDSDWYVSGNTVPVTITDLRGGRDGKTVHLLIDDPNTSISVSQMGPIRGGSHAPAGTIKIPRYHLITFVSMEGHWYLQAPSSLSSKLHGQRQYQAPPIGPKSSHTFQVPVPGAATGDEVCSTTPSAGLQSLGHSSYVSAADTVEVVLTNNTAETIILPSMTWHARVNRQVA